MTSDDDLRDAGIHEDALDGARGVLLACAWGLLLAAVTVAVALL